MNFDFKRIHFIGIGGIGMSALARLFKSRGLEVSGSDMSRSEITDTLEKEGIKIFLSQTAENISDDIECVIYTIAVKEDNLEFAEVKKRALLQEKSLPIFTYAEMLGKVSSGYYTIAISGTHGKTTTTAMTTKIFQDLNLKPSAIVGSLLSESKSNFVAGESNYFIVEACEYGRSFHNLSPKILVITNLEEDHLDYYADLAEIQGAFKEMVQKVPADGFIICDPEDKNLKNVIDEAVGQIVNYKKYVKELPHLFVPGGHNRQNAAAALAVISVINNLEKEINLDTAKESLKSFKGTWRRLEFKGETINGALVYDDYAHHPSEIKSSLLALKEKYADKKILVIFQPHLYSRTKSFLNGFADVLRQFSDRVLVLPIYAAREKPDGTIDSMMIVEKIYEDKAEHAENFFEATRLSLDKSINTDWVIVTVGAGDVSRISNMLALTIVE
jgi:UDP-N-acetylmuramate--alanine ligase